MLPLDLTQIVLLAVIIVLTIFLVVLGLQVFFVLRDLRSTLRRLNQLFAEANTLVSEVKKPIEKAGTFVTALTTGAGLVHLLKKSKNDRDQKQQ